MAWETWLVPSACIESCSARSPPPINIQTHKLTHPSPRSIQRTHSNKHPYTHIYIFTHTGSPQRRRPLGDAVGGRDVQLWGDERPDDAAEGGGQPAGEVEGEEALGAEEEGGCVLECVVCGGGDYCCVEVELAFASERLGKCVEYTLFERGLRAVLRVGGTRRPSVLYLPPRRSRG